MSSKVANPKAGMMGGQKVTHGASMDFIQNRIESLSSKMDRLINVQEEVLGRLDGMSQEVVDIEKGVENLKVDKEEIHILPRRFSLNKNPVAVVEMKVICQEMSSIMTAVNQRSEQQAQKLEGMEKLVLGIQQMISFIGETVKNSSIMERLFKGPAVRKNLKPKDYKGKITNKSKSSADTITKKTDKGKDHKARDEKEKPQLSLKGLKAQKKKRPLDATDSISLKKQELLLEEVKKLNRENAEKSSLLISSNVDIEAGGSHGELQLRSTSPQVPDYVLEEPKATVAEEKNLSREGKAEDGEQKVNDCKLAVKKAESKLDGEDVSHRKEEAPAPAEAQKEAESPQLPSTHNSQKDSIPASEDHKEASPLQKAELDHVGEASASSKRHVIDEDKGEEDHKKSRVEKRAEEKVEEGQASESPDGWGIFKADGVEIQVELKERVEKERVKDGETAMKDDEIPERFYIDNSQPPVAPFNHRIVSAKPNQINNFYTINRQEILGGGRFGQVHKCVENSSGLTLAAKIIKARTQKEKEVVKNEIQVMNQLDHANLIQLYAAYESRGDIILVLEYVDGGELFDRIIDENYTLMELDTVMFIRQICEGLQHMHKMSILHLDLKPENILCVSRLTNKVKIIDFGLARIYKPREKLQVNFGTPEFLAPEVINYDFVSYNTDMWSLGIIAYMLLSGLCPFLGDDDNETLNNILSCRWSFEEDEFTEISDEAKDFITKCLIFNKSWRIGASEALRHPWLSDSILHHRLNSKKTMCRSRRSSCVPPI